MNMTSKENTLQQVLCSCVKVLLHSRVGRIDPNIDGIDTNVGVGIDWIGLIHFFLRLLFSQLNWHKCINLHLDVLLLVFAILALYLCAV